MVLDNSGNVGDRDFVLVKNEMRNLINSLGMVIIEAGSFRNENLAGFSIVESVSTRPCEF